MPAIERLAWTSAALDDYLHWQSQDRICSCGASTN
jgi:hypothetical protein